MPHPARPLRWLVAALLQLLLAVPALAQERVALVIGNGAYRSAPPLANPANDARAMAGLLERLGFQVETGLDLDRLAMEELVATFEEKARAAEVAFVFYAGHGIQVAGRNYLVPIDASLRRESDVRRLIEADWVLESAGRARRLAVVFLDACRDNPLAESYASTSRSAAVGRGLASIGRAPANLLVAYATAADATAADGLGRHSPFTEALLEHLPARGVELRLALGRVRDSVARRTDQQQIPYTYGSLGGDEFYLAPAAREEAAPPPPPAAPAVQLLARSEGGAGAPLRDCPDCPELVPLAAGRFNLGSPPDEPGHEADEGPQRAVRLARPFAIGRFEVTMAEWDACAAAGACAWRPDDRGLGRGRLPAFELSAEDALAYLAWLTATTGHPYRLPSEAEWEYAARALSASPYPWGTGVDPAMVACEGCAGDAGPRRPAAAGSFPANAFGLFDMAGSLWEWTADCWNERLAAVPADGRAADAGNCLARVLKGGSFLSRPHALRPASRDWAFAGQREVTRGFRVARDLLPGEAAPALAAAGP